MFGRTLTTMIVVLLVSVLQVAVAAEPPAGQLIPDDAILVIEVSQPKVLLDVAFSEKMIAAVKSSPAFQQAEVQPGFQEFLGVISYLETQLGADRKLALAKLLGGSITLAVCPGEQVLLIVDSEDPQMLQKLHDILLGFAKNEAQKQGQPDRVRSAEYRGVTGWTFNDNEVHAIIGNRLLAANKPDAIKAALDLRENPSGGNLTEVPAYQTAKEAAGTDAVATAFLNLDALKQHVPLEQALTENPNPAAALLVPGVVEAICEASWVSAGLKVEGETVSLRAVMDATGGEADGPASYAWSNNSDEGALPNLTVPHRIAGLSFYRDMHAFYAAKDELFPERTSGLIFFENMMGIFFTGRDLTEEVLGGTRPEIRFVVAEQQYDPSVGTPTTQLPAFAAVIPMRDPERFSQVIEEAWQKALGFINFTRGQQAESGLIMDRFTHSGIKFTVTYFASSEEDDKAALDTRFNFRPALAIVGDSMVISSTESLARDLIDALQKEAATGVKALAKTHSLTEVSLAQLSSALNANREGLVRQNMVDDGNTRQQAETQIDLLLTIAKYLGQANLSLGTHHGQTEANLEFILNLP